MPPPTPPTSGSEDSPRPIPTTAREPTVSGSSPYPTPVPSYPTPITATPAIHATLGPSSAPGAARRDTTTAICAAIHRSLGAAEVVQFVRFAMAAVGVHRQLFPGVDPPAPEYVFSLYLNFRAVSASLAAYTEMIEVQLAGDVEALFEQLLSAEE